MKKGNMELGKKIITWAMAAVMTVTSVGGSFGTMTVYAEEETVAEETTSETTESSSETTEESTVELTAPNYHKVEGNDYEDWFDDDFMQNPDNSPKADGVNNEAEEYNNLEESGAASVGEIEELAQAAQGYAIAAKTAANEAIKAIGNKTNPADGTYEKNAQAANGEASNAATAADNAATEVSNATTALTTATTALTTATTNYNGTVEDNQDIVDSAVADITIDKNDDKITEIEQKIAETTTAKREAVDAKKEALEALADTLEKDGEERVEAAAKVQEAANKAAEAAKAAGKAYDAAVEEKEDAIAVYNLVAMLYGEPLYGKTAEDKGYTDQDITDLCTEGSKKYNADFKAAYDKVNAEKTAVSTAVTTVNTLSLDSAKTAVSNAETAISTAKTNYDTAKAAATEAMTAAVTAAGDAATAAGNPSTTETPAVEASAWGQAEKAQNYSVDLADSKIATINATLETEQYKNAETNLTNAKNNFDKKVADEWNKLNWWDQLWTDYDSFVKNLLEKTDEGKAFTTAEGVVEQKEKLKTDISALEKEKATKQQELETIKTDYLNTVTESNSAATQQLLKLVNAEQITISNNINQAEFDKALNDWANKFFNAFSLVVNREDEADADELRGYMIDTYKASTLQKVVDESGFTCWVDDTLADLFGKETEIEKKIDIVIEVYKDSLRVQEEAEAMMNAKIAALSATEAAQAAQDAITNATKIEKFDAKTDVMAAAKSAIDTAETSLTDLKKTASTAMQDLSKVELTELFNAIAAAEKALDTAKGTLSAAKAASERAQQYADYAKNYAGYVNDESQKATGYVRLELDENGNPKKDDNGNYIYATENPDYDLTNKDVSGKQKDKFTEISEVKNMNIPEDVYKAYVNAVVTYDKGDRENGIKDTNGKGLTTGDTTTSMPLTYWKVGEDGKLTGEYFFSTVELETGRYFTPYVMKKESDMATYGYHMDGIILNWEKPEEPAQEENTPDAGTSDGGSTGGGSSSRSSRRSSSDEGAVLGAKREQEGLVPEEGQVLGAVRAPKTSDASKAILWMLVMGGSALGAAAVLAQKKKEEA